MASFKIDIKQLFQNYFGFIPYNLTEKTYRYKADYYEPIQIDKYKSDKFDHLGRPIFEPLILGDVLLPIVSFSLMNKKKIITTPVVGRQGSVKELIGFEDVIIDLNGFVFSESQKYPHDEVIQLIELYERNEALEIKNNIINNMGVTKVVIQSLNLPVTKHINIQPFKMKLISDNEFEAILSED